MYLNLEVFFPRTRDVLIIQFNINVRACVEILSCHDILFQKRPNYNVRDSSFKTDTLFTSNDFLNFYFFLNQNNETREGGFR
jgi:hypothetical protein